MVISFSVSLGAENDGRILSMNILIFSHSSGLGGAEKALLDLVGLLTKEHRVLVMLPSQEGVLVEKLKMMGVECGVVPMNFSLPNPAGTLLHYCDPKIEEFIGQLKTLNYDLVITNTVVNLLGLLIGRELNIPCITYVHEYIFDDTDLAPHGCTAKFYLSLINSLSNHLLCASEYVKNPFLDQGKCSVLYPFTPYMELGEPEDSDENFAPFSLVVIGTKSRRKNTHFAITVLKALRLRGKNVSLHIIGSDNSGSFKLAQQFSIRGEKNVFIHPYMSEPFKVPGKKINLVCSYSEPFGLTISESLARGIPIVASESGGPKEILPTDFIYAVDDVDQCVRAIEKIIANYEDYSLLSKTQYLKIIEKNTLQSRAAIVSRAIELAALDFNSASKKDIPLDVECFKKILNPIITAKEIIQNISDVSQDSARPLSVMEICNLVMEEIKSPGSAVLKDMHEFDVVPFGHSENSSHLYKNGIGLAIDLLANIKDTAKQNMIAYTVLRLQELKLSTSNPKVLCLGDGLGIDSIILASCGFDIRYINFDQSLMSRCAELNVKDAINSYDEELKLSILETTDSPYDAIISLEAIENVPDPRSFLKYISDNLKPGGLLFISECFDGIYDRWPTHQYLNEKFASALPILLAPLFKFEDMNTLPFGKPYLFSKNLTSLIREDSFDFFNDPIFLHSMMNAKAKIGF